MNPWRSDSAITPAVRPVLTRKYAKAESVTASHVSATSPRAGARRRNVSPATNADVANEPELNATFWNGLRFGVTALIAACTSAQNTPMPVPYSTYDAMTAAKETEIAELRKRT